MNVCLVRCQNDTAWLIIDDYTDVSQSRPIMDVSALPLLYNQEPWGLILGLRPANERRRYFVTTSLIGWAQARNHNIDLLSLQQFPYIKGHYMSGNIKKSQIQSVLNLLSSL